MTDGKQTFLGFRPATVVWGSMALVGVLLYPLLILSILYSFTGDTYGVVSSSEKAHVKSLLARIPSPPRNVSVEPPAWMEGSVFHSPKVFAADYAEMRAKLKIYIYPIPSEDSRKFGGRPPNGSKLPSGNYASEHYAFRGLYESEFLTDNPDEATFFALPFSVFNLRMTVGPKNVSEWVKAYMENQLKRRWPYWNRTGGADHFYMTCHDIGVSAAEKTPHMSGSAIQVICPASRWKRNYIPTKDFALPQIWPRYQEEPGGLSPADRNASKILAFWSGSQNSKLRKVVWDVWADDDDILLGGGRVLKNKVRGKDYSANFRKAKYCLHITGYEVYTCRIGDSIYFGCVPVILSDHYELPFADVLDWNEFAVIVAESQVPNLKTILKAIPDETYEKLHRNVNTVRRLFMWNSPPQDYDIFHMIMYDLWLRRFVLRPSLSEE